MREFMRNKLVSVARRDDETILVHAVLDDSIYSLEIDLTVTIDNLVCTSIVGRWLRWTTPECPRALDFLGEAAGFCLAAGIEDTIHKTIGRKSCRHYANLLIECAHAAREAVKIINQQKDGGNNSRSLLATATHKPAAPSIAADSSPQPGSATPIPPFTAPANQKPESSRTTTAARMRQDKQAGPFIIDLHVHTSPASPCASASAETMIEEAMRIGLDGICLTDHNHVWTAEQIETLRQQYDFVILRGNEIVTNQGDMLVFGFDEDIQGVIKLEELKRRVAAAGGFLAAAHPFRGFLTFGAGDVGLTTDQAIGREMFRFVDAIEARNGKVTDKENGLAAEVAERLNLPATGGSDAHDETTVGVYATRFDQPINNETELVAALKAGRYKPVAFR